MKKIFLGSLVTINLLFIGCGSNTPKDVAIDFATALSDADIESINEMASSDMIKELDELREECNAPYIDKLREESARVFNLINHAKVDKKYQEKMKKIDEEFRKNSLESKKEMQEELIKKYGALNRVPQDVLIEKSLPLLENYVEKMIEIVDIEMEEPKKIREILSRFITRNMMQSDKLSRHMFQDILFENIVRKYVKKHPQKITPKCVEKHTDFGSIDSVNFIEERQKSPDKVDVRLEIIHEDGKSKKVLISVEQIKEEWKVSRF